MVQLAESKEKMFLEMNRMKESQAKSKEDFILKMSNNYTTLLETID